MPQYLRFAGINKAYKLRFQKWKFWEKENGKEMENEQMESNQFRKEPSYDGIYLPSFSLGWQSVLSYESGNENVVKREKQLRNGQKQKKLYQVWKEPCYDCNLSLW